MQHMNFEWWEKFMDQWKWYIAQIKWDKWNTHTHTKDDKWTTCDKWKGNKKKMFVFPKCCKLSAHNPFLFMFLFRYFFLLSLNSRLAINSIVIAVDCNRMLQHDTNIKISSVIYVDVESHVCASLKRKVALRISLRSQIEFGVPKVFEFRYFLRSSFKVVPNHWKKGLSRFSQYKCYCTFSLRTVFFSHLCVSHFFSTSSSKLHSSVSCDDKNRNDPVCERARKIGCISFSFFVYLWTTIAREHFIYSKCTSQIENAKQRKMKNTKKDEKHRRWSTAKNCIYL